MSLPALSCCYCSYACNVIHWHFCRVERAYLWLNHIENMANWWLFKIHSAEKMPHTETDGQKDIRWAEIQQKTTTTYKNTMRTLAVKCEILEKKIKRIYWANGSKNKQKSKNNLEDVRSLWVALKAIYMWCSISNAQVQNVALPFSYDFGSFFLFRSLFNRAQQA